MQSKRIFDDLFLSAFFLLCIVAALFVPLPPFLLDLLIAFNIAFSLLLLLIGLSLKTTLTLLTFPAVILLTTLFRISLNVASTRLILSEGDAGQIIESFGTFLIRGEIAVGIIIFLIITVVNFIVVARGSSRISEVAARFTLDALPGKQLAVDSDLRAGLISADEARGRRDDLRKESQLYGSMDGAMKFIQGDVIAGVFIIFVNIFGGLFLGIKNGMSFTDALTTYTTLTIGDGLVTQIPALLVSICAGIVITRVSSGQDTTLGRDLIMQLFRNKKILLLAAGINVLIAALPGLPALPFVIISASFVFFAYYTEIFANIGLKRRVRQINSQTLITSSAGKSSQEYARLAEQSADLEVQLSRELYTFVGQKDRVYLSFWRQLQRDFHDSSGLNLPGLRFTLNGKLSGQYCQLRHQNFEFLAQQFTPAQITTLMPPEQLMSVSAQKAERFLYPLDSVNGCITANTASLVKSFESAEIRTYDAIEQVLLHAVSFYLDNPGEVISLTDLHKQIKDIDNTYPGLFTNLFEEQFFTSARIMEVVESLAKGGIYFRDLKELLEVLSQYFSAEGRTMVEAGEFSGSDIIRFIRTKKTRVVGNNYIARKQTITGLILSSEFQSELIKAGRNDLQTKKQLLELLENVYAGYVAKAYNRIPIIVPDKLRKRVLSLLKYSKLQHAGRISIPVLSFKELDRNIKVEVLGLIDTVKL